MNQLNVSLQHSITTLAAQGWSHRRIARELDINRETVGRYLRLADSNPAISTLGSAADPAAKPAISTPGSRAGRQSLCQPWQPQIAAAVSVGLSAQRIYQDLVVEHGFGGSYQAVKRFVRQLRQTQPVPFVRMEVAPGAEAQVDFGQGAWVLAEGKRKRPHLFRIVLSHSRKGYSEVVWQQPTEGLIRCLENAFRYFGGVPRTLISDNLRAAVTRADWYDPELNTKVEEFCRHYGTVLLPTRPAMLRHKGKIEAGVKFAQNNALKGRSFESLAGQNLLLSEWESGVVDTRIHGPTRQQVGKVFNESERAKLLALPGSLFPVFEEAPRTVHRDGYVELKRAYYSVPPEYVGRQVWVRWESRLLRVVNQRREVIAVHALAEPGQFTTDPTHLHSPYRRVVQESLDHLLDRARLIGTHTGSWAEAKVQQRGPIPGNIEFNQNATAVVQPPMEGRLQEWLVNIGDRIKKDDVLARIESPQNLGTPILLKTPLNGEVIERNAAQGDWAKPGDKLVVITELQTMWAVARVREDMVGKILTDEPATIRALSFPGETFAGKLLRVAASVEPETRTVEFVFAVPNPDRKLRGGMFAQISLAIDRVQNKLLVPDEAVQTVRGRSVVFVEEQRGQYRIAPVRLGNKLGESYEVLDGLSNNVHVVTSGSFTLKSEALRVEFSGEQD